MSLSEPNAIGVGEFLLQAFAERVQQIEALKKSMTASLRELEQNFQALMQEAFGG